MRKNKHSLHGTFRASCAFLTIVILLQNGQPILSYASSWKPALLVNTEAFQSIDDSNATADVVLKFGDTINKTLTYERTAGRFKFDDDLKVEGSLTVSGAM